MNIKVVFMSAEIFFKKKKDKLFLQALADLNRIAFHSKLDG